ncbi:hypothetical protein ABFS83_04G019200 [Erythranthe nasuta]
MFCRRPRTVSHLHQIFARSYARALYSTGSSFVSEPPRKLKKNSDKKPWVTDINELKRKSRLEKQERKVVSESTLKPPENGLLVKELIPTAHNVLAARTQLLSCVSRVSEIIPIYVCSVCREVHVGDPPHKIKTCSVRGRIKEHAWERGGMDNILPVVESFHLYDRLGRAVSHNERLQVDRIPALVELCIQAGVENPEYPTRRRDFPIYRVAGKMIDFEKRFPKNDFWGQSINASGFWEMKKRSTEDQELLILPYNDLKGFAEQGMKAYENLHNGVEKIMKKYAVQTCGYCSEVQVGPKGHRVRQCQAFKHQMRGGQHGWQEATIDDLFPPVYVWHVRNKKDSFLVDALKRYYGKLPALVELFAQAGATVGEDYRAMMREDVVVPGLDEDKFVA